MILDASSWAVFDGLLTAWLRVRESGWAELDALEAAAALAIEPERAHAIELCRRWESFARGFVGLPSDFDWSKFRPLRLGREEDWSDWLAFLLETGPVSLAQDFLGPVREAVKAEREYQAGAYRADIVVDVGGTFVSIEVKLDDPDLAKTFHCCDDLERSRGGNLRHLILLPEERIDE